MKKIANKFFYRIDNQNRPVPGTLARFVEKPKQGVWKEVSKDICCPDICQPFIVSGTTWPESFSLQTDILINVCGQQIILNNVDSANPTSELRFNIITNAVATLNLNYSDLGTWHVIGYFDTPFISAHIGFSPTNTCSGPFTVDVAVIP